MKINTKTLFFVSLALNILVFIWVPFHLSSVSRKAEESAAKFPFLSKRIFVEDQNDLILDFAQLRADLKNYIAASDSPIMLYFEYLPTGVSVGVNDRNPIKLASLVKVPVAMATYEEIKEGHLKKDEILTIKKSQIDSQFGDLWKKGDGAKVSVEDALEAMLKNSDNTAVNLLIDRIGLDQLEEVVESLDLPAQAKNYNPTMSMKEYTSVFRSLYLATYLSKEDSNNILNLLTQTDRTDRIVSGVPKEVKVAHKYGLFRSSDGVEEVNNDCGIVYAEKRPYLLCVAVFADEKTAAKHISTLSKKIYDYVVAKNR